MNPTTEQITRGVNALLDTLGVTRHGAIVNAAQGVRAVLVAASDAPAATIPREDRERAFAALKTSDVANRYPNEFDVIAAALGFPDRKAPRSVAPAKPSSVVEFPVYRSSVDDVMNALWLISEDTGHITEAMVAAWDQRERDVVFDWAMSIHFHASDNPSVKIPPRPECTIPPQAAQDASGSTPDA